MEAAKEKEKRYGALPDEAAREKIKAELETSFFVEAGAGSGKTYCLVQRMANLVRKGKAEIENIAAVTFTRKAAAELKERFQIRLENDLKEEIPQAEKENLNRALANLEQVFTGTIHSFCSRILRERPVEAGVDPDFEEIDEEKDSVFAGTAWHDYVEYASGLDDPVLKLCEQYGINFNELKEAFLIFNRFADVEIVTKELESPDFTILKKDIKNFLEMMREQLPAGTWQIEKGPDKLQELFFRNLYYLGHGYLEDGRKFIRFLKELNKKAAATQNRWPCGNGSECQQRLEEFQEEKVGPALKSWQEYLHKPLSDFIKKGVDYYRSWRKERSLLNFEDLLTLTAALLEENREVRQYFKKRYTHLLVDEFQDTDPVQAQIILFLTGADTCETDWKKIVPVPGSLFLVGDPKQSIYRFRRADIDIYNAVKEIFTSPGCEILSLQANFRSLPFMQEFVGEVFSGVFPKQDDRYQAKFLPLQTVRTSNIIYDQGIFVNEIGKVV
jgi:ATP-dependent helicase/nuclease subunit A